MKTKWDILEDRLALARHEVNVLEHYMEGLKNTPCDPVIHCSGCGKTLETEAEVAQHFARRTETSCIT